MQGGAKLEHQLGAEGGERDETQLIEHDQVLFEGRGQEFRQAMVLLSQDQLVDQGGGVVETDVMALPAGSQGQASGDMGFAEAGIAHQDNRLGFRDVVAPGQVQNALFVDNTFAKN